MTVPSSAGVRVAVHELGGSGPALVLAHAAGLHGMVFAPLAARLDGFRCVAFDGRGHGDTALPDGCELDWPGLADDLLAVVDGLGLERPFAFGHSSGGTAALLAEQARPGTFRAIYCFEPVLIPADPSIGRDEASWLAASARRRRDAFASVDEALAHYAGRPPLAALHPDALRAYVEHGFEGGGTGVRLKCRPEVEAAVYETASAHDGWARLGDVACPVMVAVGSASQGFVPDVAAAGAARLPRGRTEVLDGLGHFGPLERPEVVAAAVRRFLAPVAG
ncbi:MAG TPA: alpha/beta hydrolase [Acidimicrobiales bacterium]|nr:alpha/beta hydrolase [Acidimicrobiales bacterium]